MRDRTTILVIAIAGGLVLAVALAAAGRGVLAGVLTGLWVAGWLYRYWELR